MANMQQRIIYTWHCLYGSLVHFAPIYSWLYNRCAWFNFQSQPRQMSNAVHRSSAKVLKLLKSWENRFSRKGFTVWSVSLVEWGFCCCSLPLQPLSSHPVQTSLETDRAPTWYLCPLSCPWLSSGLSFHFSLLCDKYIYIFCCFLLTNLSSHSKLNNLCITAKLSLF